MSPPLPRPIAATLLLLTSLSVTPSPHAGQPPRSASAILTAIDALIAKESGAWCQAAGLEWPPSATLLRVFKKEMELEIWAKNKDQDRMVLVRTLPVCAMDSEPGPKLAQGDGKTPEGYYTPEFGYGSSHGWMWIDLTEVDRYGEVGRGSSFKMCIDYPNSLDRKRSTSAGKKSPGGEICLHGNCVTAGCVSLVNRDFLPVFSFSRHHDVALEGPLQLHIYPFRFDQLPETARLKLAKRWTHSSSLDSASLLAFWANLEEGFRLFEASPGPLRVRAGSLKYLYGP